MSKEKFVKDIMTKELVTIDQDCTVLEACQLMTEHKIGAVVILSPIKDAIGIFTERDLLNRVASKEKPYGDKVRDYMTPNFVCVQAEDELEGIAKIMIDNNFRHLPVADGHDVVAMLSIRDIVKHFLYYS
ncbi:MAG: CBS domain-containing protein [Bdellovibrionota bacterium]|nr:CBS domain-containing protein [Bdellovibrionota bacterium]